ncbi:MAG: hypothetical protein M3Q23_00020 [Actinomycetota bacterium]|nr:hypothetical protein [Actinomycetota bacterium]
MRALIAIVYIVVGVIVAATHQYFVHLGDIETIASAVLAVLLWPLVLFGVDLHLGTKVKSH